MYDFEPTATLESKVIPGVRFTIKNPTSGQRTALSLRLAAASDEHDDKINEMQQYVVETTDEDGKKTRRLSEASEGPRLLRDAALIERDKIMPVYIDWGLISIEGLSIAGKPATPVQIWDDGPESLSLEIVKAIKDRLEMKAEDQKNWQSPTTGSVAVGAAVNSLPAKCVSIEDFGFDATDEAEEAANVTRIRKSEIGGGQSINDLARTAAS